MYTLNNRINPVTYVIKYKLIYIWLLLIWSCNIKEDKKNNNKVSNKCNYWSTTISNNRISIDFKDIAYKVDTTIDTEAVNYSFRFPYDSSCLIISSSVLANFECCDNNDKYEELTKTVQHSLIDKSGKIKNTNLYWRQIKNEEISITYNYCPLSKLSSFNNIMDTISKNLLSRR